MQDENFNILQGQISALNTVIIQLALQLTQIQAAEAALGLAVEQEEANQQDETDNTPPTETRARNRVLSGYVDLLQSVASRD